MPKNSTSNQESLPIRKNISDCVTDSFNRFAYKNRISKIDQYVADNVLFVTTKTVAARKKDGRWEIEEVKKWLIHSGDSVFADELKTEIDLWARSAKAQEL